MKGFYVYFYIYLVVLVGSGAKIVNFCILWRYHIKNTTKK